MEHGPNCGGDLKIIAAILETAAIERKRAGTRISRLNPSASNQPRLRNPISIPISPTHQSARDPGSGTAFTDTPSSRSIGGRPPFGLMPKKVSNSEATPLPGKPFTTN